MAHWRGVGMADERRLAILAVRGGGSGTSRSGTRNVRGSKRRRPSVTHRERARCRGWGGGVAGVSRSPALPLEFRMPSRWKSRCLSGMVHASHAARALQTHRTHTERSEWLGSGNRRHNKMIGFFPRKPKEVRKRLQQGKGFSLGGRNCIS